MYNQVIFRYQLVVVGASLRDVKFIRVFSKKKEHLSIKETFFLAFLINKTS